MSVENICNIVFVVAFVASIHVNVMISFFVLLVRRNLVSVLPAVKAEKVMVKKKAEVVIIVILLQLLKPKIFFATVI